MRILVLLKTGQNSNVCRRKQLTIPMLLRIRSNLQCLEGYGPEFECLQWKDKIRIRVFITIGPGFQCFKG